MNPMNKINDILHELEEAIKDTEIPELAKSDIQDMIQKLRADIYQRYETTDTDDDSDDVADLKEHHAQKADDHFAPSEGFNNGLY